MFVRKRRTSPRFLPQPPRIALRDYPALCHCFKSPERRRLSNKSEKVEGGGNASATPNHAGGAIVARRISLFLTLTGDAQKMSDVLLGLVSPLLCIALRARRNRSALRIFDGAEKGTSCTRADFGDRCVMAFSVSRRMATELHFGEIDSVRFR